MMLQASIGRTAENAEVEQLEATIECARNLGLPSDDPTMLLAQNLSKNLNEMIMPGKGCLTRLKFKARYVEITMNQLQAIRKAIFLDDFEQLTILLDACALSPYDSPYVKGPLCATQKKYLWTYRSDLLYDNWGMDWHYRKSGYSVFRHACAQSSTNIVFSVRSEKNVKGHANGKSPTLGLTSWESAVVSDRTPTSTSSSISISSGISSSSFDSRDFFICHSQASGGDQAQTIALHLKTQGYSVWYDMDMPLVNENTMREGVQKCKAFILFLSENVFQRPFCRFEIKEAVSCNKVLILVYEPDVRHGAFDFCTALDDPTIPLGFKDIARALIGQYEAIPYRRKKHERDAMLCEILRLYEEQTSSNISLSLNSSTKETPSDKIARLINPDDMNSSGKDFPPGYEIIWPIVGILVYFLVNYLNPKVHAGMIALIVANRGCSWEYWWKYRKEMGKVYDDFGGYVVCKTLVRYTDSGFILAALWALWPVLCDGTSGYSTIAGLNYEEMTSLTFCVLFAIAVGFWAIYPLQAYGMHNAPGCWWYNLTGDMGNHGPMLVCVSSRLCLSSSLFPDSGDVWKLPLQWTFAWYFMVFLPWFAVTGDELYRFIPADKIDFTWKLARALGTLMVCGCLCLLTMVAYRIGRSLSLSPDKCYFIDGQNPERTIASVLIAVYFFWLLHAYSLKSSPSGVRNRIDAEKIT